MKSDLIRRERAHRHIREIADQAGPLLSSTETPELLKITRQTLDERRRAALILGVRAGDEWRYPALQFKNGCPLPRLQEILAAHHGIDGWVALDSILVKDTALW